MAVLNRIVVIGMALVALIAAGLVVIMPEMVFNTVENTVAVMRGAAPWSLAWTVAGVAAVAMLIIIAELWPRQETSEFLAKVNGASVVYTPEAVANAVEKELAGLEGVRFAKADVTGHGRSVDIVLNLVADANQDSQSVAARAVTAAREKIEHGLGLKLAHSRLTVQAAEPAIRIALDTLDTPHPDTKPPVEEPSVLRSA